jgi:hypothetical protein
MAELAESKRDQYKTHAPVFHRPKPNTRELHASFLASLDGGEALGVHGRVGHADGGSGGARPRRTAA